MQTQIRLIRTNFKKVPSLLLREKGKVRFSKKTPDAAGIIQVVSGKIYEFKTK